MAKKKKKSNRKPKVETNRPKVSARPVSRQIIKAVRRDRRTNPSIDMVLARLRFRDGVKSAARNPRLRAMRERIEREDHLEFTANQLYEQYRPFGCTWAACVQAVKTDWVPQFRAKWA